MERHSFHIVSGESPETTRKLCLSTKFPYQEIRWNYGIFRGVINSRSYIMLEKFAKDGINTDTRDSLGNFPIHIAAQIGNSIIFNLLLKNNASINATNFARQTVLLLVAQKGRNDVFDVMKQHDLDDGVDRFGKTAECYARENGHYEKRYVEYLSLYS